MANQLSITESDVAVVEMIEGHTYPAAAAIDAGCSIYLNSSGDWAKADHDAGTGVDAVAAYTAPLANAPLQGMRKGVLDVGDALSGVDYGASLYLSSTAGKIDDALTADEEVIGDCVPAWSHTTADKLLRVDL